MGVAATQRQNIIEEQINAKEMIKVEELVSNLGVSKATILRDLNALHKQQRIKKTHGGAMTIHKGTNFEPIYEAKKNLYIEKKKKIAKAAKKYINRGETVLLDTGSTTLALAEILLDLEDVTIITCDLQIAKVLCENEKIELIVLGGQRRKGVYSLIGSITEEQLKDLNIDKVFMGADAIDIKRGITNANLDETNLKRIMLDVCREVILLVDHTKFNKVAFSKIADIREVEKIITDEEVDKEIATYINTQKKVQVIIAY